MRRRIGSCWINASSRIGSFLVHRYADTRMFIRAFSSMFGSTTSNDIDTRVGEIYRFRTMIQECVANSQTASTRFDRLQPQTQALFFYTTASYIARFQNETDPRTETIRQEILRECDLAISLQRTLTSVNTCFRSCFTRSAPAATTVHPVAPSYTIWETFARMFGGPGLRTPGPMPGPMMVPGASTVPVVNLNIPDTVPYVRGNIPADIQTKADEIARLRDRVTGTVPLEYEDYSSEVMCIPVFDASQPLVQSGLPALRTAIDSASGVTAALSTHRNSRHPLDKDVMEAHIAVGSPPMWEGMPPGPAVCSICRHPVKRTALMIDTGLQDEILRYLRGATSST